MTCSPVDDRCVQAEANVTPGMSLPAAGIAAHFADLPDPRVNRRRRHRLSDILTIALCAVLCGADDFVEIELFGRLKKDWFQQRLDLPNGIPSHDTFTRVFAQLDPEAFRQGFRAGYMEALNQRRDSDDRDRRR